ncbi:MAG: hemolysin III family protein [Thermoanaerobaculia bacterium]
MYEGERFNSITHVVGAELAVIGTSVAVTAAALRGDAWTVTAFAIYGALMTLAYLSSALYHSFRGRAKQVFRIFDHCAIYLLIAGTYTPLTLVTLRGKTGWWLFGAIWTLAIIGIVKDSVYPHRLRALSVVLYVLMGWLIVFAFRPLTKALPPTAITWLVAGGIVYTVGIVFFAMSKKVRYSHGVWHLFVIGGSLCHFMVLLVYVALAPSPKAGL